MGSWSPYWHGPVTTPAFLSGSRELARRDPVMASLVEQIGPPRLRRPQPSAFEALARSIVFQQLAGAAAHAIYTRFRALVPGPLSPAGVLALSEPAMRAVGLSGSKVASIRDLAAREVAGELRLRGLSRLSDEAVIERLIVVRGVGVWTAQMFLIFQLRRPDVWPTGDLGVRKGFALAHELPALPTPAELELEGDRFRPHRSTAAWYCWRATDTLTP